MSKDISNQGAWIFISHSNKDFEKVRRVRNEFEELGHKPLLFFLKCIKDDSELMPLIMREIEAREWFMLCDSDNASNSPYVQKEIKYIENLKGKKYEKLHLDDDWEKQREKIRALAKRATVYLSYSTSDRDIAKAIADKLLEHDFGIYDFHSVTPEKNLIDAIGEAIEEVVEKGFFLTLVSPEAMKSEWVEKEIQIAITLALRNLEGGSNIIPVLVGGSEKDIPHLMRNVQYLDFTVGQFNDNMTKLIEYLKNVEMK